MQLAAFPRTSKHVSARFVNYKGCIGVIWGLYGENGKENGNYYFGFRVEGFPKDRLSVG